MQEVVSGGAAGCWWGMVRTALLGMLMAALVVQGGTAGAGGAGGGRSTRA